MKRLVLACLLIGGCALSEAQTTYYVKNGGNDGADGLSDGNAWETIGKVDGFGFGVGDTVQFKRGDTWQYTGDLALQDDVNYVDYSAGALPIIEFSARVTTWGIGAACGAGDIWSAAYVGANNASEMLWDAEVKQTRQVALGAVVAVGDFYFDGGANTLHYCSVADPDLSTINFASDNYGMSVTTDDGTLTNIVFKMSPRTMLAISGASSGWVVTGCQLTNGNSQGAQVVAGNGQDIAFTDTEFDNFSNSGAYLPNVTDTVFTNCTAHDNVLAGIQIGGGNNPTGNLITQSSAYDNGTSGFVLEFVAGGNADTIEYSTAYGNSTAIADRQGIAIFSIGAIIRYNVLYSNDVGGAIGCGINVDNTAASAQIYYNITYSNGGAGIAVRGDGDATGHQIYGNVMYANQWGFEFYGTDVDNAVVENNIISENTGLAFRDLGGVAGGSVNVTVNYNIYFKTGGLGAPWDQITYDGNSYNSVAAFNAGEGHEANGIEGDPVFTNPGANDFTLQSTSPAIGVGITLAAAFDDALHPVSVWRSAVVIRDQDTFGANWEMGAFVYPQTGSMLIAKKEDP